MEDASNQGRMRDVLDSDAGVALMDDKMEEKKAEEDKVAGDDQVQGRQAEIYKIDMDHASKVLSMQEDEPEEVQETEAQARRNMIMYLKNVVGFRLDYFNGMSYDDIRPIFEAQFNSNMEFILKIKEQLEEEENRAIQSINKTPAQKTAKRRKLNKEVKDLKRHLQIVPDEDDDVYIEATPLARKMDKIKFGRVKGLSMVKQMFKAGGCWNHVEMDDPYITMEECIQLMEDKGHRHDQKFNWETATYVKRVITKGGNMTSEATLSKREKDFMFSKSKFNEDDPWYADFANYIIKKEEPYAFKLCVDNIIRRCVGGIEILEIMGNCHSGHTGGHHSAKVMAGKVYQAGFYWPSVFKNANEYVR
nr:reverse transcriptase domain-containing protein [Tanacetum cinerariifolium]